MLFLDPLLHDDYPSVRMISFFLCSTAPKVHCFLVMATIHGDGYQELPGNRFDPWILSTSSEMIS